MRTKKGTITSAKMTGTVTVNVDSHAFHPKYKKRYKVSKKFLADTAGLSLHEGDLVLIGECRPLSKNKHFKVVEILRKAPNVGELSNEKDVEEALHREKVAPVVPAKQEKSEKSEEGTEKKKDEEGTEDSSPEKS